MNNKTECTATRLHYYHQTKHLAMKSTVWKWFLVLVLVWNVNILAHASDDNKKKKRPPRPEKLQEEIPSPPGPYHTWQEGRWKWKKKEQEYIWKEGYWRRLSRSELADAYYSSFGLGAAGFYPFGFYSYRFPWRFYRPVYIYRVRR